LTEEKLLAGYEMDPLYIVGMEGFYGCLWYLIFLPIFQFVNCNNKDLCNNGKIEDSHKALTDLVDKPKLLIMSIGIVFSIASFNGSGVFVTKYASAA